MKWNEKNRAANEGVSGGWIGRGLVPWAQARSVKKIHLKKRLREREQVQRIGIQKKLRTVRKREMPSEKPERRGGFEAWLMLKAA